MTRRFNGLRAARYEFKEGKDSRPVIAFYAGEKVVAFIEFTAARRLVDRVHDLADARDREIREGIGR